jgi:hypothetical protein
MTETKIELSRVALGSLERALTLLPYKTMYICISRRRAARTEAPNTSELVLESVHTGGSF